MSLSGGVLPAVSKIFGYQVNILHEDFRSIQSVLYAYLMSSITGVVPARTILNPHIVARLQHFLDSEQKRQWLGRDSKGDTRNNAYM